MVSANSILKHVSFLLFGVLVLNCFNRFGSYAQRLPPDEVKTLQAISTKLKNLNWNVSETSCNGVGFFNRNTTSGVLNNVTCDCTFGNGTICHVTNIMLKELNLTGVLPTEFGNLTFLKQLDLTRNYINGSIPPSFGRLPLTELYLLANRLTGPIPKEIGDIASLQELVIEDNQLDGPLDANLGKLSNLRRLVLSGNNFSGTIPVSFGNLKNLTDFRISGTGISGKIPDFIGNWNQLAKLDIQGTAMEGPIPSTISLLTSISRLAITDLKGLPTSKLPDVQKLANLTYLTLRNCLIADAIPEYIGGLANLIRLDLSFNKLTGPIPASFENWNANFVFLSNNLLSGPVPSWVLTHGKPLDISYNNFVGATNVSCALQSPVNLVSIYSSPSPGTNQLPWCLTKGFPCPGNPQNDKFFINCGGNLLNLEGKVYQEDLSPLGSSHFSSFGGSWAYSSTGVYSDNSGASYIINKTLSLNITGPAFYQTARVAPVSLKYYGFCLRKGTYKVRLHFAEIVFSNDQTFSSLGKRIFDVSIQGKVVLKDFNIMEAAGGAGIGIFKDFNVAITGSTLEIQLYWAGKGTNGIPTAGNYGPLISAIEVTV